MNEDDIARVLRAAGPRERPPAEIERSVRNRLRDEWLVLVAEERHRRQRRIGLAMAAGLAAAAVVYWTGLPGSGIPAPAVATLARASGEVRVESGWLTRSRNVAVGQALREGDVLVTGDDGRVAIALASGQSARLDHGTRIALNGPERVTIEQGALYVDTGRGAGLAAKLKVVTPSGTLRHLGTQYEVRRLPAGLRLRVREGRVAWKPRSGGAAIGVAGEQLTIADDGAIERARVARHGESWDWVASMAPVIDIEGRTLGEFLTWAGRELGCSVDFVSSEAAAEAATTILHGSIDGLTPAQSVDAVLATTRLRATVGEGRIEVAPGA